MPKPVPPLVVARSTRPGRPLTGESSLLEEEESREVAFLTSQVLDEMETEAGAGA
jgi:hypothetical protein